MDLVLLIFLGGLLALDGTSLGQVMISRPLIAGALTGWVVGDPATGLLIGGLLEIYFISIFPVGGSEFPEGGPAALVAVVSGVDVSGPQGVVLGVLVGFVWSRLGAASIQALRKANGRLAPDPSRGDVSGARIRWTHVGGIALDFFRGCILSALGLAVGPWFVLTFADDWPLDLPTSLIILGVGACVTAGALVGTLGGWKKRGVVFGAGLLAFFVGSLVL